MKRVTAKDGQFLSQIFLVPKKDGSQRPVVNLKPLNRFVTRQKFKMEGARSIRDLLRRGDWMVTIDLKDAYLSVPVDTEHRQYLRFIMGRRDLRIPMSPIRTEQCSEGFHQANEASDGATETSGSALSHLPGRSTEYGPVERGGWQRNPEDSVSSPTTGVPGELGEITAHPISEGQLPGFHPMLPDNDHIPPRGKDQEDHGIVLRAAEEVEGVSEGLIGRMSAAILAILPAPLCYRGLQRLKNETFASSQSYETIVSLDERAVEELIWWTQQVQHWNGRPILTPTPDITVETDASLLGWGAVSGETRTGGLWSEEERAQHINMLELMGGDFAAKIFAKDKQDIHIHLRMDNTTAIAYINHMGGTKSHNLSQAACSLWQWCLQRGITLSAEHLPGTSNTVADVESCTIRTTEWMLDRSVCSSVLRRWGSCSIDLFTSRLNNQLPRYVSWHPDPFAVATDAFQISWQGELGYAFPHFLFGRQMPHEGTTRRMYNSPDCPNMEHPAVVPSPTGAAHRLSITSAVTQDALTGSIQQAPPNDVEEPASASRLETVRASHSAGGISTRASALITSGWSKGTNATYQSGWNRWHRWCDERDINPLSCDIKFFLDFLAELFDQGLQHRSINIIRSAVSMTHSQLEGVPIGQHPLVTRLLKGVYNLRPPMPRYSSTWDVGMVTKYLTSLGRNEDLPLKRLSQKLALLMALVEACRTLELKALDLRFKVLKPEGVSFKLASLTKKRTPGLPPKELFFGAFPGNECLCVVKCLSA